MGELIRALVEVFVQVFFEFVVVGTGHGIGWVLPMRHKFTDSEAGVAGVLFWLAVIASAVWWRLS